jgi:hypothetical protein
MVHRLNTFKIPNSSPASLCKLTQKRTGKVDIALFPFRLTGHREDSRRCDGHFLSTNQDWTTGELF